MKLGYLTLVPDRSADTLVPIMRRVIIYGSIVHSDEWAAYRCLDPQPALYGHLTVNHQHHFVDPQSGCTTNHIEAYWSRAKRRFKQMYGTSEALVPSYLDEFMWRERYGMDIVSAFRNILDHIAQRYPQV